MNRFAVARPQSYGGAVGLIGDESYRLPVLKAGGIDVVDHLKEGLIAPDLLVDVKGLGRGRGDGISRGRRISGVGGLIRIRAATTLAEIAASETIRADAPVIAQAVGDAASPQVRNVATAAGNLLQRPRCWYYRHEQFHCLKKGGSTCYAFDGENKFHAILGGGPCHIVHPSNLAVAMMVCRGEVFVTGSDRQSMPIGELFHGPDRGIESEHVLLPGEIVTSLSITAAPISGFYAIKEKQSFDWPLVMAAVAMRVMDGRIRSINVCAGAVAPVPWPLPKVERALRGVSLDDDAALRAACARSVEDAEPMRDNAYKLKLLPVAVHRAIRRAAEQQEAAS